MSSAQTMQLPLFAVPNIGSSDRLIKLRDVERSLAECFHQESRPSRNTIIGWLEEGILLGKQLGSGHNYYVWESSLNRFKAQLSSETMKMAA